MPAIQSAKSHSSSSRRIYPVGGSVRENGHDNSYLFLLDTGGPRTKLMEPGERTIGDGRAVF